MGESVTSEIVSDTPPSMPMEETPAPAQMASTETMGSSLASLAPSSDVPSTAGVDAMGSSLASLGPSSDDPAPQMDVLAPAQFVSTSGGISGGSSVSSTQTPQASGTLRANDFSAPAASEEPKDFLAYIRGGGVRTGGQRGFGGFGSQIGATRDRANGAAPALAYSFPSFGGPQQRPFVFG
ncbi:hypothetical protein HOP50_10g58270 [Chloropicon primus]|uniref:Uncharacterized protein n=1 Tax=Chloropicon primus TaxID=1764295 RepID=A0A5B8MRS1_9CHLO|nr:hypothetical protein A3770_10p58070 [Chloropicon primus]UPR02501.1 hypothetical protein HOP50_10g58270 [Chloropicon primus]|eukprot:QDZ23289.1 hypothetical protein A3770_10p58070 [Chloropicon primus]